MKNFKEDYLPDEDNERFRKEFEVHFDDPSHQYATEYEKALQEQEGFIKILKNELPR